MNEKWTRRAIERVLEELPAGTRTEAGRRRSKLVGWLVERLIDRGEGDRR